MRICRPSILHLLTLFALVSHFETQAATLPVEAIQCKSVLSSESYDLSPSNVRLRAHLDELGRSGGWPKSDETKATSRVQISATSFPLDAWILQRLTTVDGSKFIMLDVGFANFKADQPMLEKIFVEHFEGNDYRMPFVVEDVGQRLAALNESRKWRWGFHNAVIQTYADHPFKQKYLDVAELSSLNFQTMLNENSDVIGLIVPSNKPLFEMSRSEVQEAVALTLQLTYATPASTSLTDFNLAEYVRKARGIAAQKYLPFMDRMRFPHVHATDDLAVGLPIKPGEGHAPSLIPTLDISEFLKKFNAEFAGRSVAEINRWSKPMKSIPEELQDYIWLKIFEKAEKNDVQVLFASTDRATKKLLGRKYGFELYHEIERPILDQNGQRTGEFAEPEFVMKLEVGSEAYVEAKRRMQKVVGQGLQILTTPFLQIP